MDLITCEQSELVTLEFCHIGVFGDSEVYHFASNYHNHDATSHA